jgi:polysaccharide export outer membrane protein
MHPAHAPLPLKGPRASSTHTPLPLNGLRASNETTCYTVTRSPPAVFRALGAIPYSSNTLNPYIWPLFNLTERPMQRIFWYGVALTLLLGSCVPNRRIVYLQNQNEPASGEVKNADSARRTYATHFKDYTFKPRDIISLRIASITPGEYDFVQQYEVDLGLFRKLTQYDLANRSSGGINQGTGGQGFIGGQSMQTGQGGMTPLVLDRMQSGFELDETGSLELPYIGTVILKGLTISEAEALIKSKLTGYFETPVVRIQLLNFNFTILGEVRKEGRYTTYDPNTTIIDALAISENLTDYADRSKIKVIRTEGTQAKVLYINILSEDLLGQSGYYIRPNDVIIVPPLRARYAGKYVLPNTNLGISILTATLSLAALIVSLSR